MAGKITLGVKGMMSQDFGKVAPKIDLNAPLRDNHIEVSHSGSKHDDQVFTRNSDGDFTNTSTGEVTQSYEVTAGTMHPTTSPDVFTMN